MEIKREPQLRQLTNLKQEHFGQVFRQVLFSPETTGNNYLKMAYINVPAGAQGTPHHHLGEEIVYTISGHAVLTMRGVDYHLTAGACLLIPPDTAHPARVLGEEPWVAVAAYCDECPVLKKALGKEGQAYPLDVPAGQE